MVYVICCKSAFWLFFVKTAHHCCYINTSDWYINTYILLQPIYAEVWSYILVRAATHILWLWYIMWEIHHIYICAEIGDNTCAGDNAFWERINPKFTLIFAGSLCCTETWRLRLEDCIIPEWSLRWKLCWGCVEGSLFFHSRGDCLKKPSCLDIAANWSFLSIWCVEDSGVNVALEAGWWRNVTSGANFLRKP